MSEADDIEAHPNINSVEATQTVSNSNNLGTSFKSNDSGSVTLQNDLISLDKSNVTFGVNELVSQPNLDAFIIQHLSQSDPNLVSAIQNSNSSLKNASGVTSGLILQDIDAYSGQALPVGADNVDAVSTDIHDHLLENANDFASFSALFPSEFPDTSFIAAVNEEIKLASFQSLFKKDTNKPENHSKKVAKISDNVLSDDASGLMSSQNNTSSNLDSSLAEQESSTNPLSGVNENIQSLDNTKCYISSQDNSGESISSSSLASNIVTLPQDLSSHNISLTSLALKDSSDNYNTSISQDSLDLLENYNAKDSNHEVSIDDSFKVKCDNLLSEPQLSYTSKTPATTIQSALDAKNEHGSKSDILQQKALDRSSECKVESNVSEPSASVPSSNRGRKPKKVSTETPEARKKRLAADAARKRESRLLRKMELSQFLQPNHVIEARQQRLAAEAARKRHGRLLEKLESVGLNTNSLFVEGRIQPQPQPQPIPMPLIPPVNFNGNPASINMEGPSLTQSLNGTFSGAHTAFTSPKITPLESKQPTPVIQHKSITKESHDKNISQECINTRFRTIAPAFPVYPGQISTLANTQILNSFNPSNISLSQQIPMPFNQILQLKNQGIPESPSYGDLYNSLASFTNLAQTNQFEPFSSEIANFYQQSGFIPTSQNHEVTFSDKRPRKSSSNHDVNSQSSTPKEKPVKRRITKEKKPKLDAQGNLLPVVRRSRKKPEPMPYNEANIADFSNKINNGSFINSMLPVSTSLGTASQQIFMPQEPTALDIFHPFHI